MILVSLLLHPFAGSNFPVPLSFNPGLNIILGENEAGKSTLMAALRAVLFRPTNLTAARFQAEFERYVPVGGGDTIRVTLAGSSDGRPFQLEKCWSSSRQASSVRLWLSSGVELTDPAGVEERLSGIRQFSEGTFQSILFTGQSLLSGTIEALRDDGEGTRADLADKLRDAAAWQDGISMDRLKAKVDSEVGEHFTRWDEARQGPEAGRGVENPWTKGAGLIVRAYYECRRLDLLLGRSVEFEQRMDRLAGKCTELEKEISVLQTRLERMRPFVEDARKRNEVLLRLEAHRSRLKELQDTAADWPRKSAEHEFVKREINEKLADYRLLEEEKKGTSEFERQEKSRKTLAEAAGIAASVAKAERRLADGLRVDEADMEHLRRLSDTVKQWEIQHAARKLHFSIESSGTFSADLEEASGIRAIHLSTGERFDAECAGELKLRHPDWLMRVRPGGEDFQTIQKNLNHARDALAHALGRLRIASCDEAAKIRSANQVIADEITRLHFQLKGVMRIDTLEVLRAEVAAFPDVKRGRSEAELELLLRDVKEKGGQLRERSTQLERIVGEYQGKFGTVESLTESAFQKGAELKKIQEEADNLRPLPDGYGNAALFLQDAGSWERELEEKKNSLGNLREEKVGATKEDPGRSQVDIREDLTLASERLAHLRSRGRALLRVQEKLETLFNEMDGGTFAPLHRRVEEYMRIMTTDRHPRLEFQGSLPVGLPVESGRLGLSQLSGATFDALALALRLSMAEVCLGSAEGMIVLDDPLVNFDPSRQRAAAACIVDFAQRHQVLFLTCHPAVADVFAGNTIILSSAPRHLR